MKNYFTDHNAMACPWVESSFFETLLPIKLKELRDKYPDALNRYKVFLFEEWAKKFNKDGYAIINLGLKSEFIDQLKSKLLAKIKEGATKTQAEHFHYSDHPRVFEAWKTVEEVQQLACNELAMEFLEFIYGREAFPFQTINFLYPSNQFIHSDAIHFNTMPHRWMAGFWTALEDMTFNNGPLVVYPGSHKEPIIEFQDLNMKHTEYQQEKDNYTEYENYVRQLIEAKGYQPYKFMGKKGQALVWSANLLHGGSPVYDPNATRWSQATHVCFPGCDHYYCSFYSDPKNGIYAEKEMGPKDIRRHMSEVVGDYKMGEKDPVCVSYPRKREINPGIIK